MLQKIIDIHTHTYPEAIAEKATVNLGHFYNFSVDGKGTYQDLEMEAKQTGVTGFLLFSVATNAHQVSKVNDFIAATVVQSRKNGFETAGFAGMHQDFEDFEGEINRIETIGLQGIKIHPDIQGVAIDDPRLYRLYEIIAGRMPLYLHMGDNRPQYRFSEPQKLAKVLQDFPKLEVVAAHLGGYQAWEEAETCLAGKKNVWFDTSSALWAMSKERAVELIHEYGSETVLFGTDYPVVTLEDELKRFYALDLTSQEQEDILYKNAKRFLKI